ncbi:hypothetical protein Ae201684P_017549 [Aphanomyces euteiches]|uniref:Uncharacterized protein n=1 Tax=Aphanomyces euteiches TaxID=100861 RepID=A0A6G0XML8_9STRA|nr:hypothetical protein Ae201684_003224 [Aphanomyces euteiches]KAH9098334.1 hypothetical protein Ae201684P_017549 [Aphanomyces euteiches]KAH9137117.1 hypothetical protein AeRB84_017991 [Aphanomyces euteiches]
MKHLNESVLPYLTGAVQSNVSENTARRYMLAIGYKYDVWKQDVYYDGHEREDVVTYRDQFCLKWLHFFERMNTYDGDDMIDLILRLNRFDSEVVWVTHDESVFYANDDSGKLWTHEVHFDLPKKSRGRSVMVSDFLCPCHGRLYIIVNGKKEYACSVIHVGKDQDGYWTNDHLIALLRSKALAAFEFLHPNATALFTFGQSTNHGAFASDALRANCMNLGSGGSQPIMRNGSFGFDKTPQSMCFPINHENPSLAGKPKGLRIVLQERGLWRGEMRLKCKETVVLSNSNPVVCCARHCMAAQPDFLQQQSQLEETVRARGHEYLFFPKYHCELNPIESFCQAPCSCKLRLQLGWT